MLHIFVIMADSFLDLNDLYEKLGTRLRMARIKKNETQADLGVRAGVSRQLVGRMEQGDPSVSLEKWARVSEVLGLLDTWEQVLVVPVDPFEEFDRTQQEERALTKKRVRPVKR